jgi:putative two-component system response regulator
VLLVHGDDAQRRLALVCLRHAGYNVTAAAGAAEALEFCRRQPPDAVVSELRMSGMDGYELAFALRQDPRIAGAPIILTCTPSDPVDLELVTAAGASALVTETADLGELVDAIRSRLEPPRRADTSIDSVELAFMAGLGVGLSAGGDGEGVLEDVLARCTEMGGPESPSADQTGHDEPLIGAIAAQLARWLGRARANAALSRRQRHVVGRLTRAAEFRDEETANHTERVSAYSGLLARLSGLDGRRSELIAAASAMHDIGKLGIPDSILRKAGPLTATERIHMQRHAEYGHRILAGESDPLLDLAATIALTHHERWDGAGYPYGISGPDIPLAGRIVAIGDVFDALTSDRVYRPAMTVQEALGEMRAGRGTHFDPELLDLFVSALPQVLEIRRRHPDRVSERPAPVAIA